METWVLITLAAAFLQNIRSVLQKHLKGVMGTTGATFVRFGFGVPFALVFVGLLAFGLDYPVPRLNLGFAGWVTLAALAQIAAQALLIQIFSHRNFTVGTAYSRTEPAQAALFGLIFLGDRVSTGTLLAIAISLVGVVLISIARSAAGASALLRSVFSRTAALGLASGTIFGIAAVAYRAASLSLEGPNFMMQAAVTLLAAIILQTIVMLVWMTFKAPEELGRVRAAWKISALVGLVGATASFGWFMAMTLQTAAAVKALAQVEMIFTFASSVLVFREHVNRLEISGCILIVAGILVLLLV
ncbi:MAG: DMT family transporter [Hoeflea sp.]|uniref:EamA family transporter n=1 Tax=Hoeflea sp. TaxID=1940281 RepID=UPI001D282089|nr:EamA family transporter [Hoeflea sp.]MBU4531395.1 DMT family transporter [Alphaproteobacteria bacterium]MBU4544252.1 DMT family transporter [Alphaproteobacteria bacterium]MBU4550511.1 DMT family transporter [Alphaproteobacteria bacterium]MBV1724671.1 DMT family transporter [Hoeflea sp.]MBV1760691.1 DMT family transporter [Hoeflea sp.]